MNKKRKSKKSIYKELRKDNKSSDLKEELIDIFLLQRCFWKWDV